MLGGPGWWEDESRAPTSFGGLQGQNQKGKRAGALCPLVLTLQLMLGPPLGTSSGVTLARCPQDSVICVLLYPEPWAWCCPHLSTWWLLCHIHWLTESKQCPATSRPQAWHVNVLLYVKLAGVESTC